MLGLVGTVGGAVALEVRRWRNKGTVQELNEYKRKERELQQLLEVRLLACITARLACHVQQVVAHNLSC
jgi:hypothetical protein